MKLIPTIVAAFAVLFLASCSKTDGQTSDKPLTYPTDATVVTSDGSFMLVYKSGQTGKSYYVHRLSSADVSKMPEASVVKKGTNAVVLVPIKDGKIVDVDASDRAEVESKIPPGMLL